MLTDFLLIHKSAQDEPLNTYLQLGDCPELEIWATKCLKEGSSFKALNTAGEMIGIIINAELSKTKSDEADDDCECNHPQFAKILHMMDYAEGQIDLFGHYPQYDRAMDAKIMSVNDAYRGAGICKALTKRTIEHMAGLGLELFHVMCTSQFSAALCERLGFDKVYELPYADYLVDGVQVFKPAVPHVAMKVYAKIV